LACSDVGRFLGYTGLAAGSWAVVVATFAAKEGSSFGRIAAVFLIEPGRV
jgi:hypothetical protein